MSKNNKPTTTKASAKPAKAAKRTKASDAERKAAVAQAQAADAAANATAVNPDVVPLAEAMKPTKATKGSKAKTPKTPKTPKAPKAEKAKKTSGLDAAAQVLTNAGQPMRCKDMVETMLAKGMWKTDGKTPAATIYAAILREIQTKGGEARFKKTDRGLFTINGK
jgi:hypothetical protein